MGEMVDLRGWICDVKIGGEAHVVELALVPGWSGVDHLADIPMVAAIDAVGGRDFRSPAAVEKAVDAAAVAACHRRKIGVPGIDVGYQAGTIRQLRWAERAEKLRGLVLARVQAEYRLARNPRLRDWELRLPADTSEGVELRLNVSCNGGLEFVVVARTDDDPCEAGDPDWRITV